MTSTIEISRTALEGAERVMRRKQWIADIGIALIGSECRAVAITPHEAVLAGTLQAGAGSVIEGSSFHTPDSQKRVSVELERYSAIAAHGASITIVMQAAAPVCFSPRHSRLRSTLRWRLAPRSGGGIERPHPHHDNAGWI
jgi:hypothetical protein